MILLWREFGRAFAAYDSSAKFIPKLGSRIHNSDLMIHLCQSLGGNITSGTSSNNYCVVQQALLSLFFICVIDLKYISSNNYIGIMPQFSLSWARILSVFAAMRKSFRCKPLIMCVHQAILTLPHSRMIWG